MRRSHVDIGTTAAVAALSCGAIAANAPAPVTTVLGIALFASLGYVWVDALFGRGFAGLERVAVAAGLTLSVPVLGGLALQAARVPLHRAAWVGLLAGVTLLGDIVLAIRQRSVRSTAAASWSVGWPWPLRQVLVFGVAIVIAAGAVVLASGGAATERYPGFTQLWLSANGDAATASLGVSNQQGSTERYQLVLLSKGRAKRVFNLTLPSGQTWQRTIRISSTSATTADLYRRPDLTHLYRYVSTAS